MLNQTEKDEEQPYHLTPYRAFTLSLVSIVIFAVIYSVLGHYGHYKHTDLFNCIYLSIILQSTIGLGSNIEINSPVLRGFIMLQALTALLFFVI